MKLTSKAMSRLSLHQAMGFNLGSFIFEPEHFKDCVILSVKEVEELMNLLDVCDVVITNPKVSNKCDLWASFLENKLKQLEKYNAA